MKWITLTGGRVINLDTVKMITFNESGEAVVIFLDGILQTFYGADTVALSRAIDRIDRPVRTPPPATSLKDKT